MTQHDTPSLTVTTDELARALYEAWDAWWLTNRPWQDMTPGYKAAWLNVAREAARVILDKAPGVEIRQ